MKVDQEFDTAKAQAFGNALLDTMNKSALSFMISIGHRVGLFDTMSQMDFASSTEIAETANLDERYVREWLGAMVTGGVVIYAPETRTYYLPPEHAASLTREAGQDNLAVFAQYSAVMGKVEDDIVECFKNGGGVPYKEYHRFHEVMAEDSGQSVIPVLESHILPLVPGLREKLEKGIHMLDVGCGSGRVINRLASLFPKSKFTGIDLSSEAIASGNAGSAALGLENVHFKKDDLSNFHLDAPVEKYDFITSFDAIHDQGKPLNVLKGIYKALKNDGVYLMQDISGTSHLEEDIQHPIAPFLYTISCMHCMTVSLAQHGEGLGAMWGEEVTLDYLKRAGFTNIQTHKLDHDIQNNWYVITK
ncbi:class I SAM-dependent methyltransferase [Rufibacter latericius]|uniref:Methyltransferase domain-containing protein n=1 Tax=Rufibacter latericius TaxID=2487040 RepID=A0A3M9MG72_9BACT|nr:methyltransferase domain-containing protein [Rufibacter latericius]RNI24552.1 methyltransferase domain-containing protein [Rufibacter latericius]